jgi:hypothetical protein
MALFNVFKTAVSSVKQVLGTNWWLEITTINPHCTYYFGPFESDLEAQAAQPGFIADLESEGAKEIVVSLKQCRNPGEKTICHDEC